MCGLVRRETGKEEAADAGKESDVKHGPETYRHTPDLKPRARRHAPSVRQFGYAVSPSIHASMRFAKMFVRLCRTESIFAVFVRQRKKRRRLNDLLRDISENSAEQTSVQK